jgi:deazaflavin-dependent oxidoreductase (nitroreductase family)
VALEGDYEPSPRDAIRMQVTQYEETGGAEGGTANGYPVLVLTYRGAKSGKIRKTPLMRVQHGDRYILVASAAGSDQNPSWYWNLRANPVAEVQDGPVRRTMRAREVTGAEKDTWSARADAAFPLFAEYREKTTRDIPILVLEPAG